MIKYLSMAKKDLKKTDFILMKQQAKHLKFLDPVPYFPGYYIVKQNDYVTDPIMYHEKAYFADYCIEVVGLIQKRFMEKLSANYWGLPFRLFNDSSEYEWARSSNSLLSYARRTLKKLGKKGKMVANVDNNLDISSAFQKDDYSRLMRSQYWREMFRDVIILKIDITLVEKGSPKIPNRYKRSYSLLARNWLRKSGTGEYRKINFYWFLFVEFMKLYLRHSSFFNDFTMKNYILSRIAKIADVWIKEQDISDKDFKLLRKIFYKLNPLREKYEGIFDDYPQRILDKFNPINELCNMFLNDLLKDIAERGDHGRCEYCRNLFRIKKREEKKCCKEDDGFYMSKGEPIDCAKRKTNEDRLKKAKKKKAKRKKK